MENMTRGHGWRFLDFGRRLERGTNLVNLLRAAALGGREDLGASGAIAGNCGQLDDPSAALPGAGAVVVRARFARRGQRKSAFAGVSVECAHGARSEFAAL